MSEPHTWPSGYIPIEPTWWLETEEQRMRSWTGLGFGYGAVYGGLWRCRLRLPTMGHKAAARFQGFLNAANGVEQFKIPQNGYRGPYGSAGGSNLIASGNALARTLTIKNCVGSNPWLEMGSLICVNDERVYQVVDFDATQSAGTAACRIMPPLRHTYVNAPVSLTSFKTLMQLDRGDMAKLTRLQRPWSAIDELGFTESL